VLKWVKREGLLPHLVAQGAGFVVANIRNKFVSRFQALIPERTSYRASSRISVGFP